MTVSFVGMRQIFQRHQSYGGFHEQPLGFFCYVAGMLVSTTTSELDIYQTAMRVDELTAAGDMDGRAVWLRVIEAVEEIQRAEPRPDEHVI